MPDPRLAAWSLVVLVAVWLGGLALGFDPALALLAAAGLAAFHLSGLTRRR